MLKPMKFPQLPGRKTRGSGFTLIELMVAIVIVVILAAVVFQISQHVRAKLQATDALHRIRQCGSMVLQSTSENSNMLVIHASGTSSNMHDLRLYGIVSGGVRGADVSNLVYTPAYEDQASGTWPVWGLNLDDNPEIGVEWERVWMERGGEQRYAEGLRLGQCRLPQRYPLFADSADSAGVPRARFANDNAHKFAMRYANKGPVFLLDGSSRLVGKDEIAKLGITKAYLFEDNPVTNPTLVSARPSD